MLGAIAQVRAGSPPQRPAHQGPGTPGGGTPPSHRVAPAAGPPRRPSPRLTAASAPPAGGWSSRSLPLTLCRRSPAPGMGAAATGPRAGFRARVGERGSPASSAPGTGGWWPRPHLRPGASSAGTTRRGPPPPAPRDKGGGGASPRVTFSAAAASPSTVLCLARTLPVGGKPARGWGSPPCTWKLGRTPRPVTCVRPCRPTSTRTLLRRPHGSSFLQLPHS